MCNRPTLNVDLSVSAAGQRSPGEGLDSDGGVSNHEEKLSDHHHPVGLLDHHGSLSISQGQSQSVATHRKKTTKGFLTSDMHWSFSKRRNVNESHKKHTVALFS